MKHAAAVLIALFTVLVLAACGPHGGTTDGGNGNPDSPTNPIIDAYAGPDAYHPPPIPPECMQAAERGVAWLAAQQQLDGSWNGGSYPTAATGFAVLKLETHAIEKGTSPFSPNYQYHTNVIDGLNWLFLHAVMTPIGPQTCGNPDSNSNGVGVSFGNVLMYENAIALMAIVGGSEPSRLVQVAGSAVNGMTYREVAQEEVDYLAYAQSDGSGTMGCDQGGWRYNEFNNSGAGTTGDNSVSQFVSLSLEYAEHPQYNFEVAAPAWVKTGLDAWVTCIQDRSGGPNDGSSGYTVAGDWPNLYKAGALVQQFSMLGDTDTSPRVVATLNFIARDWTVADGSTGWRSPPGSASVYLAMYSVMKAMEAMNITLLGGTIDWYNEFCQELIVEQLPDGSWPVSQWDQTTGLMSTEWALLTLERAAPQGPIIQ